MPSLQWTSVLGIEVRYMSHDLRRRLTHLVPRGAQEVRKQRSSSKLGFDIKVITHVCRYDMTSWSIPAQSTAGDTILLK
jgi:hypothetical protein